MANWIPNNLKKGALHQDLGIPAKQKIPVATLNRAAKMKGKVGKRARLAKVFRGFNK